MSEDLQLIKKTWNHTGNKSEKMLHFSRLSIILLFRSFSKTIKHRNRTSGCWSLAADFSPTFLNTGTANQTSNNLEYNTLLDTYWRFQLVCIKVQFHNSLEPSPEYNQNQTSSVIHVYDLSNHLVSYRNNMQVQISSRWENR